MKEMTGKTNTGEGGKGKRGRTTSHDASGKSLSDTSTSARGQCVGESSTGAKSTEILGWALETCAENFPCHQIIPVSNLYAKTSGRTWRIGGSQIWARTGRGSADYSMYSTFLTASPGSVLFSRSALLKRKDLCFSCLRLGLIRHRRSKKLHTFFSKSSPRFSRGDTSSRDRSSKVETHPWI